MKKKGGDILRETRKALKLSQEKLGELAGCGKAKISKLESGTQKMTSEWAKRLAPYLKLRPVDLLPEIVEYERTQSLIAKGLNEENFDKLDEFYQHLLAKQRKGK